jgi:tetratricopeptide (TPR) repeat protein
MKKSSIVLASLSAFLVFGGSSNIAQAAPFETTPVEDAKIDEFVAGKAAIAKKDWRAAARNFEAVVKKDPKNADAHNFLGYSYRWLNNMDGSFKHYAIALQLDPNHRGAHEYVGIAHLKVKNLDKAKEHLARLETICGKTCEEYEDLAKAIAAYKP